MNDFESRARRAADAVNSELDRTAGDSKRVFARASRSRARVVVPVMALVLLAAGIATQLQLRDDSRLPFASSEVNLQLASSLQPFGQCDAVLGYFKDNAEAELKRGGPIVPFAAIDSPVAATVESADTASSRRASAPVFSTTNVQEAGVDEPDVVKTDGKRIAAVAGGRAYLIDDNGGRPRVTATLDVEGVNNLFFERDRLLVFSMNARAVLSLFDVVDFAKPHLVGSMAVDGNVVDARLVGSDVRVITNSTPQINVAPDQLRKRIDESTAQQWIPSYAVSDEQGREIKSGQLVECESLSRPKTFSGISTVAVTTFDIVHAFDDVRSVGVVASGQRVYATQDATYVSSTDFTQFDNPQTTYIHKFHTKVNGETRYVASGEVKGNLLNQYAMSENDGVLRVASTVRSNASFFQSQMQSEGVVSVLQEKAGVLDQIGSVGGLGKADNESITAVRFIGDKGYVVTFRQTDPLYVIDLRDARNPRVAGELKIPGFSGYLHPVGDNLVLGVGQNATDSGRSLGVQFSLFDVSDPATPKRVDQQTYGGGAAAAQFDPKAFLYWQPKNVVIAPTSIYTNNGFTGLIVLRPSSDALDEVGRLAFTGPQGSISRTFVIDDRVYMLSYDALQTNSIDTHREISKIPLQPK